MMVAIVLVALGAGVIAWRTYPMKAKLERASGEIPVLRATVTQTETRLMETEQRLAELEQRLAGGPGAATESAVDSNTASDTVANEAVDENAPLPVAAATGAASGNQTSAKAPPVTAPAREAAKESPSQVSKAAESKSATSPSPAAPAAKADAGNTAEQDRADAQMAARTRVDFEVRTGGEVEPTPGVRLGIHETSTAMQQVDGWVQGPDGRSIYLRKHPVREPVLVYSTPEGRHYELVLTQVGSSSTEGYLLVPAGEEPVRAAR